MYFGGKNNNGSYQHIISEIPFHKVYIEGFLGSGAVFRNKRLAEKSILIDLDVEIIQGFGEWTGFTDLHSSEFLCLDAVAYIRDYPFDGTEFIYLDPPYPYSTRSDPHPVYKFEMGEEGQHIRLLEVIKNLPVPVVISSYYSELYFSMLKGWRWKSWNVRTRRGEATEYLFMNYPVPAILHDARYVGSNFVERQRLRRLAGVEKNSKRLARRGVPS